ncbi:unnamed protein product [Cuscuta campestris]|uniref:Uncharacterized protein n=1 Tax=Cuscuta campestris TaxID=132261 RepID=A0A484K8N2_9ASTE|nr:unnamed protein product [Cuscuta campestris]
MRNFSAFGAVFRERLNKIQVEVKNEERRKEMVGKTWDRLSKAALITDYRCCRSVRQRCRYHFLSDKE